MARGALNGDLEAPVWWRYSGCPPPPPLTGRALRAMVGLHGQVSPATPPCHALRPVSSPGLPGTPQTRTTPIRNWFSHVQGRSWRGCQGRAGPETEQAVPRTSGFPEKGRPNHTPKLEAATCPAGPESSPAPESRLSHWGKVRDMGLGTPINGTCGLAQLMGQLLCPPLPNWPECGGHAWCSVVATSTRRPGKLPPQSTGASPAHGKAGAVWAMASGRDGVPKRKLCLKHCTSSSQEPRAGTEKDALEGPGGLWDAGGSLASPCPRASLRQLQEAVAEALQEGGKSCCWVPEATRTQHLTGACPGMEPLAGSGSDCHRPQGQSVPIQHHKRILAQGGQSWRKAFGSQGN